MKATLPIGFFLLCVLLSGVIAHAQLPPQLQQLRNITFDHLSSEQGLPSDGVSAIVEDSRGFMWLGTGAGLCRYEGYNVVVYRHNEADSTSISGNIINYLLADIDGRTIWVGTEEGLDSYNISTDRFAHFTPKRGGPFAQSGLPIRCLSQDRRGAIWVGTGKGLNELVVDSSGQRRLIRYLNNPNDSTSLSWDWVNAVCADDDGMIWVGTSRTAISRLDPTTGIFTRFLFVPKDAPDQSMNRVYAPMLKDQGGILWVATAGGVVRFDPRTPSFTPLTHNPYDLHGFGGSLVVGMCKDNTGTLWLGTRENGLHALDTEINQCVRFAHNPADPRSLCSDIVSCLYIDHRGSLWIGTVDRGISRAESAKPLCVRLRREPANPNSLSDDCVWGMVEDDQGGIWIGTSSGLDRYDRTTGSFTHFLHDPSNPRSLSHRSVQSVCKDRDGAIWAGTLEGLNRVDPLTGGLTRYYNEPSPPRSTTKNIIMGVHRDNNGTLWVGTQNGPKIVNIKKKRFDNFAYFDFSHQILGDCGGKYVWVGTERDGLLKLDAKTGVMTRFAHDPHDSTSLNNNWVLAFCEDLNEPERFLWVTTWGGGLNRLDKATGKFTRFTEREGLADNQILSIAFDGRGYIWLGTMKGLSRFDPAKESFRNYDASDGITNGEANERSLLRLRTGELCVGTPKGITIFHPDSIRDNPHVPSVVITDFKIINKSVLPGMPGSPLKHTITETKEIVLSYLDNMISFEFAALDYVMPSKNQYAYRLEGFDMDWIRSGNVRTATYTNLDPGEYVFRVKGSNNDGVWNEQGASLSIIVTPPYWRTWWFRLVTLLAFAALLYALHRYQVTKKLQLERMRVRIASDLHDDIGSTLTKIAVQSEVIQTTADGEKVRTLSGQIGTASREIITTLSDIVWSIDARNDTIGNLVDRMRDFAAGVFAPQEIDFRLTHTGLDTEKRMLVDTRQNIYLIFKEAVNNAARHSHADTVGISLENSSDRFTMTVADDGQGIPDNPMHTGHGLRNMQMRAERIGGNIQFVSDKGTKVILTMNAL